MFIFATRADAPETEKSTVADAQKRVNRQYARLIRCKERPHEEPETWAQKQLTAYEDRLIDEIRYEPSYS